MSGTGGDHELDVAGILRRAREPEGLAELRRAIESLGIDEATRSLAQILEVVHDTRQQLQGLARAIEAVAAAQWSADHLVDTTKMDTYTVDRELPTGRCRFGFDPPDYSEAFLAKAIAVEVIDYDDDPADVIIEQVSINCIPQMAGIIAAERWRAPPGRGHPIEWAGFTCMAMKINAEMVVSCDGSRPPPVRRAPVRMRITLSGVLNPHLRQSEPPPFLHSGRLFPPRSHGRRIP